MFKDKPLPPPQHKLINSLQDVEALAKLVKDYKLDSLNIEGIKLTRSKHAELTPEQVKQLQEQIKRKSTTSPEDALYWSSGGKG